VHRSDEWNRIIITMKNVIVGIFVSIVSICITLVVIECGFRLFASVPSAAWSDRPKEYFIHQDSPTFQDYPHTAVKPQNTFRIAVIGDSFTFAPYMQFDDAFPKRIERYLNLNSGTKKVEVINYGVPAYSTSHEVPVVKRAIEEGADFILMQITLNDPEIKPYTPTQLFREKNKFGDLELKGKLFSYWTSLAFVLKRLHNNQTYDNYVKKFNDLFEKPKTWKNFSDSWSSISSITKEANVPTVAVVFPLFGIPLTKEYPFLPIHQKIKTLIDSLQIPFYDLYNDFAGLPLERIQVIVGQDFHPNEIGHRIAAERILAFLKQNSFFPSEFLPKAALTERIGINLPGKVQQKSNFDASSSNVNDEGEAVEE
jgi:lysophospholipase L1-like esterase